MNKQKKTFWDTILLFEEIGLLQHLLLIGSWAEHVYEYVYYKDFDSNLKTRDIDFLIKNINRPQEQIDIIQILEDKGFIYDVDIISGVSKFYKGGQIEVEFLAMELGSGEKGVHEIKALGIKVEGLRYMNYLLENSIPIYAAGFNVTLNVPLPQAYMLHKLIVNSKRTQEKKEKDINSVKNLLEYMIKHPKEIALLKSLYDNLPKKQKRKVDEVCQLYDIKLF